MGGKVIDAFMCFWRNKLLRRNWLEKLLEAPRRKIAKRTPELAKEHPRLCVTQICPQHPDLSSAPDSNKNISGSFGNRDLEEFEGCLEFGDLRRAREEEIRVLSNYVSVVAAAAQFKNTKNIDARKTVAEQYRCSTAEEHFELLGAMKSLGAKEGGNVHLERKGKKGQFTGQRWSG
ncbi:hypothetical protein C5167_045952 [Papaver somniferum]|uniref:Uncharacterized protein n=1 Tax=Papaver somniferum TaxID=3469 RepID=A0A4Y7LD69_PAPSO|nr:hypothetical protein C5167_045952 [Papaver somniferum]